MSPSEKEHAKAHELLDEANVPKLDEGGYLTLPERVEHLIRLLEFARAGKSFKREKEKNCSEK